MSSSLPLIVTLALEDGAFRRFDHLRRTHFPPHLNHIPAHLTLFHALPGEHEIGVRQTLRTVCAARPPFEMIVQEPWRLGRGVAYRLEAKALDVLRRELAQAFLPWLTRQDQAGFRPHVTIQNKVDPTEAEALLRQLKAGFEPFEILAEGLLLWRYQGGPWEAVERFAFNAA